MDAITVLAQLMARVNPPPAPAPAPPAPPLPSQPPSDQLAAIMQLLQSSSASSSVPSAVARQGMPGEQQMRPNVSLLVRCIALDGATNQLLAPTAYKVVSMMGDVSFEGLVEAVTSRLSFSKLPGRQLRSMQACDTDGVQIVIDNDAAVQYLLGLLKRDNGVKMTVYAVDTVSPGETQRHASPTTAAAFDASATPLYGRNSPSASPSHGAGLDGSRGRAYTRTPDRRRLSDNRSASPVARPRGSSRDRGYEKAPEASNSRHQTPSPSSRRSVASSRHRSLTPSRYDELVEEGEEDESYYHPRSVSRHSEDFSAKRDFHREEEEDEPAYRPRPTTRPSEDIPAKRGSLHRPPNTGSRSLPHRDSHFVSSSHPPRRERPQPKEGTRFCALSISDTGKEQFEHHVVDHLRLRVCSVNKFQRGWNHVMDELFARKPESEQNPKSLYVEREEGTSTVLMLYMRVKGRPENPAIYDTEGDLGIIINTKALVPGSFKWNANSEGTLLLRFSTDASFPVIRKNTDRHKDPFSEGPQVNRMNHIAVNIENAPPNRIKSPNFYAITALLDALNSGKSLDIVIETTASQLPPDAISLMKFCLGAQYDEELAFKRTLGRPTMRP
ncbi:hypothetical protein TWF281_010818 [Arthrobotrys megalospora]